MTEREEALGEYTASLTKMGVPAYVVQHFGGAMLDYQNGHIAGADNNVEKLTGRRSMTVGEFAKLHPNQLNGQLTTRGLCLRGPSDGRPNSQRAGICADDTSVALLVIEQNMERAERT